MTSREAGMLLFSNIVKIRVPLKILNNFSSRLSLPRSWKYEAFSLQWSLEICSTIFCRHFIQLWTLVVIKRRNVNISWIFASPNFSRIRSLTFVLYLIVLYLKKIHLCRFSNKIFTCFLFSARRRFATVWLMTVSFYFEEEITDEAIVLHESIWTCIIKKLVYVHIVCVL